LLKNKYTNPVESTGLLWFFLLAFGTGLLALLTPCVFPMIPMTVAFFTHDGEKRKYAIRKSIVFGLSIVAIFVFIGSIVSITLGEDFTHWLSTHWLPNVLFFIIFMVFAASFLGMFEIVLPGQIANKTDKKADKGGYSGAFFMALTLAIVSFSCTAPIVSSVIILASQGKIIMPIVGMLGFSIALALPFTLFSIFPFVVKQYTKVRRLA